VGVGRQLDRQSGDGTKVDRSAPVKLGGVGAVAGVDGGEAHSLAVLTDGTVLAWGLNDLGQLGDGSGRTRTLPVALAGIDDVAAWRRDASTRWLRADGAVWAWGANGNGQLGVGSNADSNVPVHLSDLAPATAIAAGHDHSLAVLRTARCGHGDGTISASWATAPTLHATCRRKCPH
jgi:alpha-tubulin suppressor-like RCC1 family protein